MKNILFIVVLVLFNTTMYAQQGFLKGIILDGEYNEGLLGATISQHGTTNGTTADFSGAYLLTLAPGTYTIDFRFFSYETKIIENVVIVENITTVLDVTLGSATTELEEVIVSAKIIKDNQLALQTVQKKSASTMDGISSQAFKKIGDSNLSGAMKRVTGVSVQEGKYVYVRGLGDRYTKTTMNGMNLPGLDPDRNDVQIDMFPTAILENVMVYKTFTPNLSADFTGGVVNIATKSFPDEKTTKISFGVGYNPRMHFNSNYVTQTGSATDFLGFDNGARKLPFDPTTKIPDVSLKDPQLENLTKAFNPEMAAQRKTSFMNTGFSFSHGNQVDKGKFDIGYGAIFSYRNQTEYYDDAQYGIYTKDPDKSVDELFTQKTRQGALGSNNVMWNLLLSGAIKFDIHEITASIMRVQNGISQSTKRVTKDVEQTGQDLNDDILTYTQRSVTNFMLGGKHTFDRFDLQWNNSFVLARTYDPDFRVTNIAEVKDPTSEGDITYSISSGDGGGVRRFYRDLNEWNENFKVDLVYPFGEENKIKVGAATLLKGRTFELYNYFIRKGKEKNIENNPDWFLQEDNVWTISNSEGTYVKGGYEAANNYESQSSVFAAYAMADMNVTDRLRAVYGVRVEKADMYYSGEDVGRGITYYNEHTLDELNFLPSVNLIFATSENMNLRASYGKTLARPSFKEKSIAQILDPISGIFFNGNLDLQQTNIHNLDVRVENFFGGGDMFSVSGFYKAFDGHIELVTYDVESSNVTPRNLGASTVMGAEIEVRKSLMNGLSAGTNLSFTRSTVDTRTVIVNDNLGTTEYQSRQNTARDGETIDPYRTMAGQSPYLVNAFINFVDDAGKVNINLSYNVQGESLSIVGIGASPDVFVKPFHSLNFSVYRDFGVAGSSRISFKANNLLQAERTSVYKNNGVEQIYSVFKPGTSFTAKYTYTF